MRRLREIAVVLVSTGAVIAAAGCGEDTAQNAQTQAQQAAQGIDLSTAIRETRDIASEVTKSAQELAQDPSADVDERLADAETRANDLGDQLESASQDDAEVRSALSQANKRLATVAEDLQDASTQQDVAEAARSGLNEVDAQLRDAASQITGAYADAARKQLEDARRAADDLLDQLPSSGG
jgi:chromosome segregation ATPase